MRRLTLLLRYWKLLLWKYGTKMPRRYGVLLQEVRRSRARTILEIGVYRGSRAKEMIEAAMLTWKPLDVRYIGFDLFEDLSDELCTKEFSKKPSPQAAIQELLSSTGAHVELYRGFSQDTLPTFVVTEKAERRTPDLVFIDGGHAVHTILSDWRNVEHLMGPHTVVFFDDYYVGGGENVRTVGCQSIIDRLDRSRYDVAIVGPADRFTKEWGVLHIQLARVQKKANVA